jgi:hypothetical protein
VLSTITDGVGANTSAPVGVHGIIEQVFDPFVSWPDDFERPNRFVVNPPRPVVVDLAGILPPNTAPTRGLPMRVVQAGLQLAGDQPAELLGWARVTDGRWVALVRMEVPVAARRGVLPMLQWVPSSAVRPTT